eukprot:8840330-Heterocapsa_arctica.AAC.1
MDSRVALGGSKRRSWRSATCSSRVARWCRPSRPSPVWCRSRVGQLSVEQLPGGQFSDVPGVQTGSAGRVCIGAA